MILDSRWRTEKLCAMDLVVGDKNSLLQRHLIILFGVFLYLCVYIQDDSIPPKLLLRTSKCLIGIKIYFNSISIHISKYVNDTKAGSFLLTVYNYMA